MERSGSAVPSRAICVSAGFAAPHIVRRHEFFTYVNAS
jgi:hypothetical protein